MRSFAFIFLIGLAAIVAAAPALAQEQQASPEGTVRVVLTDGTILVGVVERDEETEIVLRTTSGIVMTIPREQIRTITAMDGERFLRIDPNRTRLFFAPTGEAIGQGGGYFAVYEIFAPFVGIGIGKAVTLTGGFTINPGTERLAYVAPKVTLLDRPSMSLAVGGIGITLLGDEDGGTAGLLFGVGTFGSPRASFSTGLAFGFADGKIEQTPALMLGGEVQVSNSIKLLSENYIFPGLEDGLLFSGGVRFFGDKLAADLGLFSLAALFGEDEGLLFFPWLGFSYNFNWTD